MIKHYQDYYWNKGKPQGKTEVIPEQSEISYKIVPDPYHRRYSIEKYKYSKFDLVVYDSFLLDYRHLRPLDQTAWQKELLEENEQEQFTRSLLRNQDDRAVLIEKYEFEKNICRTCKIYSVHGLHVATNRMYYCFLGDTFNGIVLYDIENRPVLMKTYEYDIQKEVFSNLISEQWDMRLYSEQVEALSGYGKIVV